jgi:hypothetical protein
MDFNQPIKHASNTGSLGTLPQKAHFADPHPASAAEKALEGWGHLLPTVTVAQSGKLTRAVQQELLFTNDSHDDLINLYPRGSVDRLVVLRIDPQSLVSGVDFTIPNRQDFFTGMHQAVLKLLELAALVKPGGDVIFSVGSGNGDDEPAIRRLLLHILNKFLQEYGIKTVQIYSPLAQLIEKNIPRGPDLEEGLRTLYTLASVQTLVITPEQRTAGKIPQLIKVFRNFSSRPTDHPNFLKHIDESAAFLVANKTLGMGCHYVDAEPVTT